ncbi:PAS domain-containing sensor histidine kinase [Paenibacillus sp. FSL A5-0031]|uniref:ATP-binding protein n=1 Tax=Paenibacillus sp. FSL A5-0031 TaxID=1920420 RepID=UPI00096C4716|nr:ATP-binding protein [Paenibacillus sp. FSL A5-0031]OME74027.1 PAS domain-containing sensor histidine kinase [Paenibacillus sp. FSL A5-0031]
MSIKMKFSVLITLIVLTFFIFQHMLSEYSMIQSMREQAKRAMHDTSMHVASTFSSYEKKSGSGYIFPEKDRSGPGHIFDIVKTLNPNINEITVFEQDTLAVRYGTYTYLDSNSDQSIITDVKKTGFELRKMEINGKSYFRSYYYTKQMGNYIISIVYDSEGINELIAEKRNDSLIYTGISMVLVLFISYWLVGVMIRPLKDILWKVNEVSSARFQQPIRIKRKDEFGLLALKVNAMSQNLSIYMNKLRRAFEENRRMKEHLESFINHTSDAIHLIDLDGKVIQVNRAFELLFGYEEEEAIGLINPILPDSHHAEMRDMLNQILSGKVLPAQETIRMTKLGELIPVSVTISPIRDSDGTIRAFASISRDMRSRNKMEELLRRSEKLTTVGQLAAGVAHEIRNPLTTLRGFLQLQQESKKLALSHVTLMLSELDRINLIVGEFLILAKPQATRFVTKDIRDVLQDVIALMNSEALLHNIEFCVTLTDDSCLISCEENQLKQVFINLLKNAIEAMPNGGRIHIHINHKREYISITITDEGMGIPDDMIPKIGDPFFTAKETGTGLGIMVSQRIINSHRGTMDIKSQVNVGTTIHLLLPALKETRESGILEA